MGSAIAELFDLGNVAGEIAVLTGLSEQEVKRLRKLSPGGDSASPASPAAASDSVTANGAHEPLHDAASGRVTQAASSPSLT